jgi:SAM-dependent MidA family methyltransferase
VGAAEEIARAVQDHGPITFAEFMELALYGRGGYYERHPVGPYGDFVTSPHVHAVFAELLARGIIELREAIDHPNPFVVIEAGAGDGTLARPLSGRLAESLHGRGTKPRRPSSPRGGARHRRRRGAPG